MEAHLAVQAGLGFVAGEDAGGGARGDNGLQGLAEFGNLGIGVETEAGGKVGRTDEEEIDSGDGGDGGGVGYGLARFDLHNEEKLFVVVGDVVGVGAAVADGAGGGGGLAEAERGQADTFDDAAGLGNGIDTGGHDAGGAEVEDALAFGGIDGGDAHHGGAAGAFDGDDLLSHFGIVAGAVFAVDEQPVKTGLGGDFSGHGRAGVEPTAGEEVALPEAGW